MAALLTCPFDVVKTHRQIELGEDVAKTTNGVKSVLATKTNPNTSTLTILRALYATKGVKALYAGECVVWLMCLIVGLKA